MEVTTFKDKNGRVWDVSLNFLTVERVSTQTGIDLLSYETQHTLAAELAVDDVKLAQTTAAILEPKLHESGILPEAFADAIASGDILADIFHAIAGAIVNFTRPHRRATVDGLFSKANEAAQAAAGLAEKHLKAGTIDREIEKQLEKLDEQLSGKQQPLSESTPESLHSAK